MSGKPGWNHKQEAKAKIRTARLGKPLSPEHRAILSEARKRFYANGGVHPKGMLGKKLSDEARAKIGAAFRGSKAKNWKGGYRNKLWLSRQRRVAKRANGGSHTREQWEALKAKYQHMCLCCKLQEPEIKLTEDHIIPLSKGGTNDISNIQPLCQPCNSLKWTKQIDYRINFAA